MTDFPDPPARPITVRDLLAQRHFMRAWYTRLAGSAAQQMLMVAVGWQMYDLTGSAWDLGLVGLYQFIPSLLLMLVAGHVADRSARGRIIAACLTLQALIAMALVIGTAGTWVTREWLLIVSVGLGLARAFQMPAQQSLIPLLVPPEMLPRALAFAAVAMQVAVIGGPALGGLLYAVGAAVVYGWCGLLFSLGVALSLRLPTPAARAQHDPVSIHTLLAGVGFIARNRSMLGALSLDLFAVLLGGATALLPIYAKDILHAGPLGLGLLRAAPAIGALTTSIALTRGPPSHRVGPWLFASVAIYGLSTLVFGLSTHFLTSMLALAIAGGADMVSVVIRQTLVQLETPNEMRGRVSAVNSIFIGASNQLGEFESGATAAWLGPVGSVVLGATGTLLVAAAWMRLFPSLWQRDTLHAATPPTH